MICIHKWMIKYLSKLFPKEAKEEISNSSIENLLFVQVEQQAEKYDFNKDYETLDRINKEIETNKEEIINFEIRKTTINIEKLRQMDQSNEAVISNLNFNVEKLMELNRNLKNIEKGVHHE